MLVTHDPLDAMVLADRLVVIEDGAIVQEGAPAEVARRPRTDYVARLVGLNLYRGTGRAGGSRLGELEFSVAEAVEGPAYVAFSPAAVALYRPGPTAAPATCGRPRSRGIERHGDNIRIHLDGPITAPPTSPPPPSPTSTSPPASSCGPPSRPPRPTLIGGVRPVVDGIEKHPKIARMPYFPRLTVVLAATLALAGCGIAWGTNGSPSRCWPPRP